jgi:phosphoglycerate dehydrogenase-like enzyme
MWARRSHWLKILKQPISHLLPIPTHSLALLLPHPLTPMKLVFPDYIEMLEQDIERVKTLVDVEVYNDVPDSESAMLQRIQSADVVVPSVSDVTASMIRHAPNLKYIIVPGIGYDQIDVKAATAAGIRVINCPTHNVAAVAEYTVGLIFAITRKIVAAHHSLQAGHWNSWQYQGTEIRGKTLGLLGYGGIGQAVAQLAIALGMTVLHANSQTSAEQLDQLIASSDILSLHLPLTSHSKYLIDQRRLGLMKPTAYLINTARGAIVEPQALFSALTENRIAGAALDVFEYEPISGEPNAAIVELATLSNVVATPHIAYNTLETMMRLGDELIRNLQACLNGDPINVVNFP